MKALKLFDKNPLVIEINEIENYNTLLKEELNVREEYAAKNSRLDHMASYKEKLIAIDNKKAIIAIRADIAAKQSFVDELKEKLLRDKDVVEKQYQEFLKERPQFFQTLNSIELKTEYHRNYFNYLRAELASLEKALKAEQHSINSQSKTGIVEGIVHYYYHLQYAIEEHSKFQK